ncbi:MAG: P-loop NTPase fold protein [Thermoleophilia bacterium]
MRSADQVRDALAPLWLALGGHAADDALAALDDARAELRRSRAVLRPFLGRPSYALGALAAIVAVPVATWLISLADVSAVVPVTSALAGAVATAGGILRAGTRWVAGATTRVEKARRAVEQEVADATSALDARLASEREAAAQAEAELAVLAREQTRLVDELAGLRAELARTTPAQVLGEFVASRFGSDDYRKRLGVAATIRRDFDALSRLIAERNETAVAAGATVEDEGGALAMNRIVLYIDDLDRCPAAKVVEVLQAVHLLLAFDLFVVVVAVDSRWLAEALLEHYPALVAEGERRAQATPADYLEKIFQIPYWVRPLGDDQRRSLIRGLLAGNVAAPTGAPTDGEPHAAGEGAPRVGPEHDEVLARLLARDGALPSLAAATLALAPEELAFLEELAPLLGATPRAVKRFANLYQLVSALPAVRGAPWGDPSPEHVAALLLALADGSPALARELFAGIAAAPREATLGALLAQTAARGARDETARLDTWLAAHPAWRDGVTAGALAALLPTVTRFSFRFGATR